MDRKIFITLVVLVFTLIVGVVLRTTGAADVTATVDIENAAPSVEAVRISTTAFGIDDIAPSGITPVIGVDRALFVTGTIADLNGKTGVATSGVSAIFYRTSKTNACLADNNNCYRVSAECVVSYDTASVTELTYSCPLNIAYYIDATSVNARYASDTWTVEVTAVDDGAASGVRTLTTEVETLLALNIPGAIDYGTLSLGDISTNAIDFPLTQRGNTRSDVLVSGADMNCDLGMLESSKQRYSLRQSALYDDVDTKPLTGSSVSANLIVPLQIGATPVATSLFWRIAVPQTGIKGDCFGANTVLLIALSNKDAQFFTGEGYHAAVIVEGKLYTWGANEQGQLGLGDANDRVNPTRVGTDSDWQSVAVGGRHTIALKTNGDLYTWGYGGFGLGHSNTLSYISPQKVTTVTGSWSKIAIGFEHSLALHSNGQVYTFGSNRFGELGRSGDPTTPMPIDANTYTAIDAGAFHSLVIRNDGTVHTFGRNQHGQLCNGSVTGQNDANPTLSQINIGNYAKVITGDYNQYFILQDGTLSSCGLFHSGRLGIDGYSTIATAPVAMGAGNGWTDLVSSRGQSAAKKTDGWYVWGHGVQGTLGLGDFNDRVSPTFLSNTIDELFIGGAVIIARTTDGEYKVSGVNGLNQQASFAWRDIPISVIGTATDWATSDGSYQSSYGLRADGTLYSWGYGPNGQLGIGSRLSRSVPQQVGATGYWSSIATGHHTAYAIDKNNQLFSWGYGGEGRIGNGTYNSYTIPLQLAGSWMAVFAGSNHAFAQNITGELYAWGYNCNGQLGVGYKTDCTAGVLSPVKVNNDTDWTYVEGGDDHTLAIKNSGALYAWGTNASGRTGLGEWGSETLTPTLVDNTKTWTSIAAGPGHSLGIADGKLYAWGYNGQGTLGLGNTTEYSTPQQVGSAMNWVDVSAGSAWHSSFGLKSDGTLWSWGNNANGALCQPSTVGMLNVPTQIGTANDWASIAAGGHHVMLRKTNGTLYACGSDRSGQLGVGNNSDINTLTSFTPAW